MAIKVIQEPQLYCEDVYGNFTGLFKQGDHINVSLIDGFIKGSLDCIYIDSIMVEDCDYETIVIKIEDIVEIHEG